LRILTASGMMCALLIAGCARSYVYVRADIPQSIPEAKTALEELARNPIPFAYKLVLIHGWRDSSARWGNMVYWLNRCFNNADKMVTVVNYAGDLPIAELTKVIFDQYKISGTVDVVGHSMGGLIARQANRMGYAKIHMLFSMASPHEGSYLARYGVGFRELDDMTPGSQFLKELNADLKSRDFEVITYWMDGDWLLTNESSESLGGTNIILSPSPGKPPFRYTHNQLVMDERTIYHVIRLLRSEAVEKTLEDTARQSAQQPEAQPAVCPPAVPLDLPKPTPAR